MRIATGTFTGVFGHEMTGSFEITRVEDGFRLTTDEGFFFDGAAPAPAWALGDPVDPANPTLIPGSIWLDLAPFTPVTGAQDLFIPASLPLPETPAVITWCRQAVVPLGLGVMVKELGE